MDIHLTHRDEPEPADVLHAIWLDRRVQHRAILQRGVERGELRPDLEPDVVLDLLLASLHDRLLVPDHPLTPGFSRSVDGHVLNGLWRDRA